AGVLHPGGGRAADRRRRARTGPVRTVPGIVADADGDRFRRRQGPGDPDRTGRAQGPAGQACRGGDAGPDGGAGLLASRSVLADPGAVRAASAGAHDPDRGHPRPAGSPAQPRRGGVRARRRALPARGARGRGRRAVPGLRRPHQRARELRRRTLPVDRGAGGRGQRGGGLQPRLQPAVRVQRLRHLSVAAGGEPPRPGGDRGREAVRPAMSRVRIQRPLASHRCPACVRVANRPDPRGASMHPIRTPSRLVRWMLAAVLVAFAGVVHAEAAREAPVPLLWKVSDSDNAVYLLGSFHLLKPGDYPLARDVDMALADADKVVFEIPPEELGSPALGLQMAQAALRSDGTVLDSQLPGETRQALATWMEANADRLRALQLTPQAMQMFEPWFAGMMVAIVEMGKAGLDPSLGLDAHLAQRAVQAGKATGGLESGAEQIAFLD